MSGTSDELDPTAAVDYLAGELSAADELAFEEALFAAPDAARHASELLLIVDGARYTSETYGEMHTSMSLAQLTAMQERVDVEVLELGPEPSVWELAENAPTYVALRFPFPAGSYDEVDISIDDPRDPSLSYYIRNAVEQPSAGETFVVCHRQIAIGDDYTARVTARDDERGERVLAEYRFSLRMAAG